MVKNEKPDVAMAEALEQQYSKRQLMESKKYAHRRDLLGALLMDGIPYPIGEVDTLIQNYDERKM